jgi:Ca-activated chloride channel family protein
MFRFENPTYLYLLIIPVLIGIGYLYLRIDRKRRLNKFAGSNLINSLIPQSSKYKPWIRFALYFLAMIILVLGLANPQIGTKVSEAKRQGIDIVILLDISNSMKSEDIKPSRLERAKQTISRLIDKMESDRVGIVVFAGDAFVQLPLTTDYAAAKLFMSVIEPDLITLQGTAIGKAIDVALENFKTQVNVKKAMLIFSDGENHEDDAVASASEAAKQGYIIHTIGMGTLNGGPVPISTDNGYLKDLTGSIVTSRLNPEMLQQIANAGNGKLIMSGGEDADISKLIDNLAGLEKREYKSALITDYEDRFQFVFSLALLLLVFELFLSDRASPLFAKINKYVESGTLRRK